MNKEFLSEDCKERKCRLCGLSSDNNEHILYSKDKNLPKKIASVFSILLCSSDPLPQCICHICLEKVNNMYKSKCQVKKLQKKWIKNIETDDPENSYIQVLNFIDEANTAIGNVVEATFGEKLHLETVNHLLVNALSEVLEKTRRESINKNKKEENCSSDNKKSINKKIKIEYGSNEDDKEEEKLSESTNRVKCPYCPLTFQTLSKLAQHQIVHLQLKIPRLFQNKFLKKNFRRGRLIAVKNLRQSIRCLNCYLVFDDNKCILEHWSKGQCDFYCQICGKDFEQSPKLLREHVMEEHGISYRALKIQRDLVNFPNTSSGSYVLKKSKQKSKSRNHKPKHNNEVTTAEEAPSSTTSSLQQNCTTCRICKKEFRNFKGCNSHMRAHKPPYAYDYVEPLLELNTDAYMEPEPSSHETSHTPCSNDGHLTVDTNESTNSSAQNSTSGEERKNEATIKSNECLQNDNSNTSVPISSNTITSLASSSPTTSTSVSTSKTITSISTAPRGIRMKFVTRRSDLNGINPAIKFKSLLHLQHNQETKFFNVSQPKIIAEDNNAQTLPSVSVESRLHSPLVSTVVKDEPMEI